jgi:hemerythrin-like metal-binding protein
MAERRAASHDPSEGKARLPDSELEMTLGVELLDVHHRQVWRRARHLAHAASEGDAASVRSSLRLLHAYLAEHCREEERWMEEAGYPGSREHVRAHAALLDGIAAARADDAPGAERRLLEAADWVARTLEAHMRSDDLKLARFCTARDNLRRLAEAGPGIGAALTPIPGMLQAYTPPPLPRRDDEPQRTPAPVPPRDR